MTVFDSLKAPQLKPLLSSGAVGVLPTDTVYGLVCQAANQTAVKRLYELKSREHKPGTIIAATLEQLVNLGIKARYLKAVEQFWPGAVSVIIPVGGELSYLALDKDSLAVRLPRDPELKQLLSNVGPLLTTSANLPNESTASKISQAQQYFGEQVDLYVDGGDLSDRKASTIIRVIDDAIEVVRLGAVTIDESGRISSRET